MLEKDSIEYTFKHDNDSLNFISSKKAEKELKITSWSCSGNIGTSLYARMWDTKTIKYYGFSIFPASIGCYRNIILQYSDDELMFYGFAMMNSHYFFYGYLPKQDRAKENFSLEEFFSLHEMIYYKKYVSLFRLSLLLLLPTSRINQIASKKPYLKHIADTLISTFEILPYRYYLKRCLYLFTFCFIVKARGQLSFASMFLIFLSLGVYLLSYSKKYISLYIWCGLE